MTADMDIAVRGLTLSVLNLNLEKRLLEQEKKTTCGTNTEQKRNGSQNSFQN